MIHFNFNFVNNKLISTGYRRYSQASSALSITDPYVIYQSLVARGNLQQDPQQMRLAKEFQKLYYRVKDYVPESTTQRRLKAAISKLDTPLSNQRPSWFLKPNTNTKEMIRVLSDEEELTNFPSPHGLLVNGDVGCGKSLLLDIFADSLPHNAKGRWHHSHFMLWVYAEIHNISQRRLAENSKVHNEFILFEVATKLIERNTILLIDEFQLPDLATAKIVKLLFTWFFKMGGVLVATSNRLPEELYSVDFRKREFTEFLSVLMGRCHAVDMDSGRDYRMILSSDDTVQSHLIVSKNEQPLFNLLGTIDDLDLSSSSSLKVYGREVAIQSLCQKTNTVKFTFNELCDSPLASSDYISLASNFETFIITNTPVLKVNMKNEARRFISLIDALYESKCKLFIHLEAPLDSLFFPDATSTILEEEAEANRFLVAEEEMFSKTQIAMTTPYRPNVSYYDDEKIVFNEGDLSNVRDFDLSVDNQFSDIKKFTGEDERFAYRRAVSRIKEMTNSGAYRQQCWKPLESVTRPWEQIPLEETSSAGKVIDDQLNSVTGRVYNGANEGLLAPMFKDVHFWSVGLWGKGERLKDGIAKRWITGTEQRAE